MLIVGRNYNGVWSDISEINIKVKNSIWKTPLAYFIYMVIISVIIYVYYNEVKILHSLVNQRKRDKRKLTENGVWGTEADSPAAILLANAGYSVDEVDDFLDEVTENYEKAKKSLKDIKIIK